MKVGLIDVDGHHFPNLALMRISAYHKAAGDECEWWGGDLFHYDRVYMSKVFSSAYSPDIPEPINADEIIKGGTGYCISLDEAVKKVFEAQSAAADAKNAAREAADKLAEASARAESAENEAAEAKKLKKDLLKARKEANANEDARKLAEKAKADLLAERDALQTRIDDLEKTPVVEVREMTEEEKAALTDRIRAEIGTETDALRAENEKLRLAADPGMQAFQRYFDGFRDAYSSMKGIIAQMNDEKRTKLIGVLRKTLGAMAEEWS